MYSLGVDIGGTKCAVVLGKGELSGSLNDFIIEKQQFPTSVERGYEKIIAEITEKIAMLLNKYEISTSELIGIGISCGGPLNSKAGTINCPPNLPDWDNVPIVKIFSERFNTRVVLHNDANACAVAEWRFGAGRGAENMVFLTFGTGMGAGLILNGKLYSGTNDLAGEVGHIRLAKAGPVGYGKPGSFEGFCSGGGIKNLAILIAKDYLKLGKTSSLFKTESDLEKLNAKNIAAAMYEKDEFALEVYNKCAVYLGRGLSLIIDILNPEKIVIGSIYERNQDFFLPKITEVIKAEALKESAAACKIVPAELGDSIGDYAALGILF